MLDNLLGRGNFKTRCKTALNRTKTRLEVIKKKRNAMQKFLKKDIAELLKSNLERNAYARVEGLYVELNMSSCYDYVEECCTLISEHVKEMHKQSECPNECRVAVASLIYAAARFSDLPDLRDLRMHFYDKYGKALEPYANKEFLDKLKSKSPTMEMKLLLMKDIAKEFSVIWDPYSLEQQLRNRSVSTNNHHGDDHKFPRSLSASLQINEKKDDDDNRDIIKTAPNLRHSQSWVGHIDDKQLDEQNYDRTSNKNSFTNNRIVPSPYTLPSKTDISESTMSETDDSSSTSSPKHKPKPRSVRTKFLKPSQSSVVNTETTRFDLDDVIKETLSARAPSTTFGSTCLNSTGQQAVSELPLPPGKRRYLFSEAGTSMSFNKIDSNMKSSEVGLSLEKSKFIPPNIGEQKESKRRHRKCGSYGNDGKFPDFDELAERVAALKRTQE